MNQYRLFLLGDDAVSVQPHDRELRHSIARTLRRTGEWIDVVPGKEIVAVRFDPSSLHPSEAIRKIEDWLSRFEAEADTQKAAITLHLDISADSAPDLSELAAKNGISEQDLVQKVIKSNLTVDMLGFTPGFAYIDGVDRTINAERLATPRQRVKTGAVGLVTGQLGFYGLSGPGGWPIIGRLKETLFDPARAEPFLLQEGQSVRLHIVQD